MASIAIWEDSCGKSEFNLAIKYRKLGEMAFRRKYYT
jgi:hypothetical protein